MPVTIPSNSVSYADANSRLQPDWDTTKLSFEMKWDDLRSIRGG